MHTLDNTGPRWFLVIEFDPEKWTELPEPEQRKYGTEEAYKAAKKDEHATIGLHLATYAPLTMAVDSGGKSIHFWFPCKGTPEATLVRFMGYAISLGADPPTWTRSQFVRMPGAMRDNGTPRRNCSSI